MMMIVHFAAIFKSRDKARACQPVPVFLINCKHLLSFS